MSLLLTDNKNLQTCGIDEAGKGCLIGPVSAAAVILPSDFLENCKKEKIIIRDSKKMTPLQRDRSRKFIEKHAIDYQVFFKDEKSIDTLGINTCVMSSMNEAVKRLRIKPIKLLVDGNYFHNQTDIPYECIIRGDDIYPSISCASILAKEYRDEFIRSLCEQIPELNENYDILQNKGYGTKNHLNGIKMHGITNYHRRTFCTKYID